MEYDIEVDEVRKLVTATFHGQSTIDGHCEARDAIAQLLRAKSFRRVMVDLTDSVFPRIDSITQFSFAQSLAESFSLGTRVAIVMADSNGPNLDFPETVCDESWCQCTNVS